MRYFNFILFIMLLNLYPASPAQDSNLASRLPVDEKLYTGKLPNGLTYYIRQNKKPENRACLRLAVNVGSALEEDNQNGLAHFAEHMAFNGTKKFPKQEIVNYLESIGMQFGPEVNAYTWRDETVYKIDVPTDSAVFMDKGFSILADWAHNVLFEDSEIDKERGVIIEEWRSSSGAWERISHKQDSVLYKNSLYAKRNTIGNENDLKKFTYDDLKSFYKKWYKPGLMSVIAVGDFDPEAVLKLITEKFSAIPADTGLKRPVIDIPDNEETLFSCNTDKEISGASINIYHKLPSASINTNKDLREIWTSGLFVNMFNSRLLEISQQSASPYINSDVYKGALVRDKDNIFIRIAAHEDSIFTAYRKVMTEAERISRFGFTGTEINRSKTIYLNSLENAFENKDKFESAALAARYIKDFLENNTSYSLELTYRLAKDLLPGISKEEINILAKDFFSGRNNIILVTLPDTKDAETVNLQDFNNILESVKNSAIEPYVDTVPDLPLVDNLPAGSKVIKEEKNDIAGTETFSLANGVRVILKPTTNKNNEILMNAFSPGGISLADDSILVSAKFAADIVSRSGLGKFTDSELRKKLAGKQVSVGPYIEELSEGLRGNSTNKDIETLFQLTYMFFTSPGTDSAGYDTFTSMLKDWLEYKKVTPEAVWQDTLDFTLNQYNPRMVPLTFESFKKIDRKAAHKFYSERFASASDFTFLFVGSFKSDEIKELSEKYLGALPSIDRKEKWVNMSSSFPAGIINKKVFSGIEQKSLVNISFTGPCEWNYKDNFMFYQLMKIMDYKLRENIREEKGGTYGASINGLIEKDPSNRYRLNVTFGCSPERVDELVKVLFDVADSLKKYPVDDLYITKARESEKRTFESDIQNNWWWLTNLHILYLYDLSLEERLVKDQERADRLTSADIMSAAHKFLNNNNYVKVVLYPETAVSN